MKNRINKLRLIRTKFSSHNLDGKKDTIPKSSMSEVMPNPKNSVKTLDKHILKALHGCLLIIIKDVYLGIGIIRITMHHLQVILLDAINLTFHLMTPSSQWRESQPNHLSSY